MLEEGETYKEMLQSVKSVIAEEDDFSIKNDLLTKLNFIISSSKSEKKRQEKLKEFYGELMDSLSKETDNLTEWLTEEETLETEASTRPTIHQTTSAPNQGHEEEGYEAGHRDPIEDTGGGVAHQSEDPVSNPVEKLKTAGPTCQYEATPGEVFGSTQGGGKGGAKHHQYCLKKMLREGARIPTTSRPYCKYAYMYIF